MKRKSKSASKGLWLSIEREMFAPFNVRAQEYRNRKGNKFAKWAGEVQDSRPPFKQAKHLIGCFGGIVPFSIAAGVHPQDILGTWLAAEVPAKGQIPGKPLAEFTLGLVPAKHMPQILAWARVFGIYLAGADIWPDFVDQSYNQLEEMTLWLQGIKKKSKRTTAFETKLILDMMDDPLG